MGNDILFSIKLRGWNRKKINAYWYITFVFLLAALAGLVFVSILSPERIYHYTINYIIIPISLIILIISILEILNKYNNSLTDFGFIVTDSIVPAILVMTFTNHDGLYLILMAPIIVSAFYFDKRKVIFAFILNMFVFFLLYEFNKALKEQLNTFEIISTIGVYFGAFAIALGIMNRGSYLINSLKKTMNSEHDLMIKNALMDRTTKIDALTDLYNHKTFYEYLEHLIEQNKANDLTFQLAIIDIDNFKTINDTYGHWMGDLILKSISDCIKKSVTEKDIVSRYGGEEFAVLFTEKTDEETLQMVEAMRQNISNLQHNEIENQNITVSIGLQTYKNNIGKEKFFRDTDACLYSAKQTGKNKVVKHVTNSRIEC